MKYEMSEYGYSQKHNHLSLTRKIFFESTGNIKTIIIRENITPKYDLQSSALLIYLKAFALQY
jgi:hypothetical protein